VSPAAVRPPSLQTKLLWGTVLVICLVMTAVMVMVEQRQRAAVIEEARRRGEVLARDLAAVSQAPLLLYTFITLEQHAARLALEDDVRYAIILDAEGRVAADSTRPERVGHVLPGEVDRRAAATMEPLVQEVRTERGEVIDDFAVAVIQGNRKWGVVRVGMSRQRAEALIRRTRWELGGLTVLTLVLGGLGAALVARRISRPVQQLAEGVAAVSRGELDLRVEPTTDDEIGRLAVAFNHMASQLRQQRTALEGANAELRQRLDELADLKSYTDNILASLTNGIVTVDLDGRVVTLNPAAEMMTGFFAGEVIGRYCTEVFAQTPELGAG
jgi:sensor histidine kinase regulating citrate/malate metabolism